MLKNDEVSRLVTAKSEINSARAIVAEFQEKLTRLRDDRVSAVDEFERLTEMEQQDHLVRILDGEQAAPVKPKRQTRISNLRETIAGIDLAMPVLQTRLDNAMSIVADRDEDLKRAILPIIAAWKAEALSKCADPLILLLEELAHLAAIDAVQKQYLEPGQGVRLSEKHGIENLFSGHAMLTKFKSSLPPRFVELAGDRWANLDDLIEVRAQALTEEIGV